MTALVGSGLALAGRLTLRRDLPGSTLAAVGAASHAAQRLFLRHVKVERVSLTVVVGEELPKHVAVVLHHENAMDR